MRLAPLNNLKIFLGNPKAEHDPLLGVLLDSVSVRVERFLNRNLEKAQRTEYFNPGKRRFFLSSFPIDLTAAFTVTVDSAVKTIGTDYWVWSDSGMIEFSTIPASTNPQSISVTYTGGYLAGDIPDALQLATIMQAAFLFRRRNDLGLSSVSMPDGSLSVNNPTKLLPEVVDTLKAYRRTPSEY